MKVYVLLISLAIFCTRNVQGIGEKKDAVYDSKAVVESSVFKILKSFSAVLFKLNTAFKIFATIKELFDTDYDLIRHNLCDIFYPIWRGTIFCRHTMSKYTLTQIQARSGKDPAQLRLLEAKILSESNVRKTPDLCTILVKVLDLIL